MRRIVSALLPLCAALSWHGAAHAWGNDGHRISGYIATSLLTEDSRRQLRELFGHNDLSQLATVLDERRDQYEQRYPGASRWHYENRAVCGRAAPCPQNQCVTRQIDRFAAILRNREATREQRIEAVTVLVHLLGDLHQPLHLADNLDRGGNDLWVRLPHESDPRRLHEVWDTQLVRMNMQQRSASAYARALLDEFKSNVASWRDGATQDWATETQALGKRQAYETLPGFACATVSARAKTVVLPTSYIDVSRKAVAGQLAKAGVRIAAVLNRELATSQPR